MEERENTSNQWEGYMGLNSNKSNREGDKEERTGVGGRADKDCN
jgi:hypothetical protein